ncbi:hypothetical protein C8A01DRAFT_41649 [Parachaetomium inaequale]|uniref:Kinesin light chain n=1 Tax=Parachaetomium inaequale TaxID=2588326 RepID=A0AAN6P524_9PEZI|nr:hypothetical protein C8A01DRAFT_41649 [Parachaetomium inaequale]
MAVTVSLALSHVWQGKAEESKGVILAALQFYREKLGPYSPATLSMMENLVAVLNKLRELEEAYQLGYEALEAHKTHLGQHHPLTLVAMSNLGITLRRQGLLEEAEELYIEVWEIFRGVFKYSSNCSGVMAAISARMFCPASW